MQSIRRTKNKEDEEETKPDLQELKRKVAIEETRRNIKNLNYQIENELLLLTGFVNEREKWKQILKELL